MKKIIKLLFCLIIMLTFLTEGIWAQRKRHRSASGSSGLKSSAGKKTTSSKKKQKASSKSKGKKSSSKKTSSSKNDKEESEEIEISEEEQCMIDNIPTLLDGDCKFLNEPEIIESLSNKFYCIYNYKDKSKIDSVYNYYLYQKYGIKETSLKNNDATVKISDNPRGASKYYEFLISELKNGSLSEGKILNFLTEEIVYEGIYFSPNEERAISSVSVDETGITSDIMKNDIATCEKAIKSAVKQCGISSNTEMQDKIEESCIEYESALIKQTTTVKNELLDMKAELANVLKQRAGIISQKEEQEKIEKEQKKREREEKYEISEDEILEEEFEEKEEEEETSN